MIRNKVEQKEWYGVILSFIYFFCVLTAYYVMRPMRDQLAAEVGSVQLPLFFTATLGVMLILTPTFGWLVSRWPRHVIMLLVYLFFIVFQLIFVGLFRNENLLSPQTLGLLFFVWVSVFNLFVVSVFWSFMADIWSDLQARRLFPIIGLGGTTGAVLGPLITRSLVGHISPSSLLLISTLLLAVAILCIIFLGRWANQFGVHREEKDNQAAIGGGIWDGLKQIFDNAFIRNMSIMMLLNDAIGTIAYVLVTDYSGATFMNDAVAQTRFAANMDLASNVIQILLQLTLTRWLLVRYGSGLVFIFCAIIIGGASLSMALTNTPFKIVIGSMPFVAVILILMRSLSYGMIQPAREALYTLVTRDMRYKGKNAVDTVVWRTGDVLSLLSIKGFQFLGVTAAGFGLIWTALAGLSGLIGWRLAKRVERQDL